MILSKKQINLYKDIISPDIPNISVLGSTQSGRTYDICCALIQYASELSKCEKEKLQLENEELIIKDFQSNECQAKTTQKIKKNKKRIAAIQNKENADGINKETISTN